jgi:hypothetical protein
MWRIGAEVRQGTRPGAARAQSFFRQPGASFFFEVVKE